MAEYALLALAAPFALWAALSDLKTMRIPNDISELAAIAFILIMPFLLPLDDFGLRIAVGGWVLLIGFFLNAVGLVGGGDVKFATVMVPYALPADYQFLLIIYLSSLLICFALHRFALQIMQKGAVMPEVLAGWQSFNAGGKFPMGFPMAVAILVYLIGKALGVGPL